jgi:Holliday junction resolvase RusA-like endonuclease
MRYIHSTPEYRVVVPGRARSFRSPHAKSYKDSIRSMAQRILSYPLSEPTVEVRVDYFHRSRRRVDMDNVAKCVLDALTGVAYMDDRQVRLQSATAYSLLSPVRILGGPVDLVKPLAQYDEYVFVRVRGYS